jgi:hypothetical protein
VRGDPTPAGVCLRRGRAAQRSSEYDYRSAQARGLTVRAGLFIWGRGIGNDRIYSGPKAATARAKWIPDGWAPSRSARTRRMRPDAGACARRRQVLGHWMVLLTVFDRALSIPVVVYAEIAKYQVAAARLGMV